MEECVGGPVVAASRFAFGACGCTVELLCGELRRWLLWVWGAGRERVL